MNMEQIKLDEKFCSKDWGSTTLYFTAPKEMLKEFVENEIFPEAVSMEISIEFPNCNAPEKYATVQVSPTNVEGEDYDWYEISLPDDDILNLIALAEKSIGKIIQTNQERIIMILEDMELYTIGRLKKQTVALTVEELQTYIDRIRENLDIDLGLKSTLENECSYEER